MDEMTEQHHRKKVNHFHEPGDFHELTFSFSKEIEQILIESKSELLERLTVQERPKKVCFRLWQEGAGYDRNLFTPEALEASIEYIHNNPVKRGLCEKATDWIWSSARFYLLDPPKRQFSESPHIYGLPQGAFDQ